MTLVTKTQQFMGMLEVEVGTTGSRGGDTGHGGRTYLRFKNNGGSDMRVQSSPDEVTLIFGGDLELQNLISGLQFAADVLKESETGGTQKDVPTVGCRQTD